MWHTLRASPQARVGFISSTTDLLQSMSRTLILAVGGLYVAWHLGSIATWPNEMSWRMWATALAIVPTIAFSLRLLPARFLAAQAVWHIGLAVAITLAAYQFQEPVIGFLYALIPLMAVVTVGWPAGLVAEGLIAGLLWWLGSGPLALRLPTILSLAIIAGGGVTCILGWVTTRTLLTVTQWSLMGFEQASKSLEEARDQRLELKQTQEDLVQANRELATLADRLRAMQQVAEEARRAKEEFVANVSHELRTPLNMIIGFSEMIVEAPQLYGDTLPPALLADITAIQRNSQHLSKLVDDVLDLSQVEAGRMALSKDWAYLQEITREAAQTVHPLYESKGLYLEMDVPPDLPPAFCDSTRIRQVVINLLSNAGRFTERGGVRVAAWCDNGDVVVSVTDTGPGITLEDQNKLFEPFQQLDGSIRRRHGGSGLGLSISKRLVEMHGGRMWLESQVGTGTTVYFRLPLQPSLDAGLLADDPRRWFSPYHQYEARTRRPKIPPPASTSRFVIVEAEDTMRRLFSRYQDDANVTTVSDMEVALRELERSPAQALIVNAPWCAEATPLMEQLAHLPHGTPAITCWVPGDDEAARRLGVVRYLVKPVSRQTLLSALEKLGDQVKTVLLVDDELEVVQLFSRMLSSSPRHYRVLQARSGQRALSLLRERRPDVMLLDLFMPEMDGFQVLREKSEDPSISQIPVVVISSRDPRGEPAMSDRLTVTRSGGLSVPDLLACIQALSSLLAPTVEPADRVRPERPASR
jgi:signal transduction histidine kinase/CheY-like chemotaxis protein